MSNNLLYYGDNLDVLRRYVADESVDLVYLDPPFNSAQGYNVLFAERDGSQAAAQIKAFDDTWRWDMGAEASYQETVENGGNVSKVLQAFRGFLGENDMLAYLTMMAPRLVELQRVLKATGSIYLHCDPTASHYLKLLMDAIFGPDHFRNEVVWKRTSAHVNPKRWGPVHDTILFYSKSDRYTWNLVSQEYEAGYLKTKYRKSDERGSYRLTDLTGAGLRTGASGKPWQGHAPASIGRHWAVPRSVIESLLGAEKVATMDTQEKLDFLDGQGYIYWTPKGKSGGVGFPQLKRYLSGGIPIQDVITDIPPINSQAQERLGYPTQKPEALLERILRSSSNEGDTALDPFCGCGTAVSVAQRLDRRWIGIDITHLAIALIKVRLRDAFGPQIVKSYEVHGEPVSLPDAAALAVLDRYQFQWWALGLVGARPIPKDQKKGADQGIDGRLYFHEGGESGKTKQIILSVKSGGVKSGDVRDLNGVLAREKAEIGVLVTLEEPSQPMRKEAATAGFYLSQWNQKKHPRLQILTIAELLEGKGIDMPPIQHTNVTHKKAPKAKGKRPVQGELSFEDEAE